jgi:hypothetical protein
MIEATKGCLAYDHTKDDADDVRSVERPIEKSELVKVLKKQ